jgi:hypothetical protein
MHANLKGLHKKIITALLVVGVVLSGASAASADTDPSADLAVTLSSAPSVIQISVHYTVTITNHGPDPLTSATVAVRLDPRAWSTLGTTTCPLDPATATLTCTFGPLPAGASASLKPWVFYDIDERYATLRATATRTASLPADRNGANDSDPTTCWYEFSVWGSTVDCRG